MEGSLTSRFLKALAVAVVVAAGIEKEVVVETAVEVIAVVKVEIAVFLAKEGMGNHRATQAILAKEGTNVKATSFS